MDQKYYKYYQWINWRVLNIKKDEMKLSRPAYLMDKLLKNNISKEELEELLANIGVTEMSAEYSIVLEKYFNQLLAKNNAKKLFENEILG